MRRVAALRQGRRRPRSLRRHAGSIRTGRRAGTRDRLHPRRRHETPTTPATWCNASADLQPRAARSKACGTTGTARWAPCTSKRPTRPSTSWPTAGCSTRRWPAACGRAAASTSRRRLRLPRSVAGRDGPRARRAAPAARASAALRRPTSSAKATCSTGGIRRRAAACARTSPTTSSGCRSRPAATSQPPATPACWTNRFRFSKAARSSPDEDSYYDLPSRSDESATLYEHCVRAIEHGLRFGAHGLPLMGSRRLERRHEPGRRTRQRRKRLAGLLPLRRAARSSPSSPARAATTRLRRTLPERSGRSCAATSNETAGTASGIAAPISTTARRSARPPTPNARSIRSRKAGRSCPAPATPQRSRIGHGMRVDRRLVRREDALIQLLDPPFDKSTLNPGYIKGYVPGVRENGGQYTHARHLDGDGLRRAGRQPDGPGSLFALINPVTHAQSPRGDRDLQGRALRRGRRRLRRRAAHRPRRLDLVHRLGRLDVPAHHGIASRACGWTWTNCTFAPCLPAELDIVQDPLPLPRNVLSHHRCQEQTTGETMRDRRWSRST